MDKTINSQNSTLNDTPLSMNPMLVIQGQGFAVVGYASSSCYDYVIKIKYQSAIHTASNFGKQYSQIAAPSRTDLISKLTKKIVELHLIQQKNNEYSSQTVISKKSRTKTKALNTLFLHFFFPLDSRTSLL